jgi:hypothetical protein
MNRKPNKPKPYENAYGPDDYATEENPAAMGNVSVMGGVIPSGTGMSLSEDQRRNHERSERVNAMLNQMNHVNADNVGNRLADFVPLGPPAVQQKKPLYAASPGANPVQPTMSNDLYPVVAGQRSAASGGAPGAPSRPVQPVGRVTVPDDSNSGNFSNYRYAYNPPKPIANTPAPYYAKMGIGKGGDDKLMEKINYMIHLLEEQQLEKTNNVMEEFLLYTFLGVFMIYIVDGFSRAGKYIR